MICSSKCMKRLAAIMIMIAMATMILIVPVTSLTAETDDITPNAIIINDDTTEGPLYLGAYYSVGKKYVTLELNNSKLESYGNVDGQSWISAALFITVNKPVHIQLTGDNSIAIKHSDNIARVQSGVYCSGMLVIDGQGALTINTIDALQDDNGLNVGLYDHFKDIVINSTVTIDVGAEEHNITNANIEGIRCENGNIQIYKSKVNVDVHVNNDDSTNSYRCLLVKKSGSLINDSSIYFHVDEIAKSGFIVDMKYDGAEGFDIINSSFWCQSGIIPVFNADFKTIHISDIEDCYGLIEGKWTDISHNKIINHETTLGLRLGPDPIEPTPDRDNTILIVLGAVIVIALIMLSMIFIIKNNHNCTSLLQKKDTGCNK